jgi:hypothetical protein
LSLYPQAELQQPPAAAALDALAALAVVDGLVDATQQSNGDASHASKGTQQCEPDIRARVVAGGRW